MSGTGTPADNGTLVALGARGGVGEEWLMGTRCPLGGDKNIWNLVEVVVAPHCAPSAGELFILKWLVSH